MNDLNLPTRGFLCPDDGKLRKRRHCDKCSPLTLQYDANESVLKFQNHIADEFVRMTGSSRIEGYASSQREIDERNKTAKALNLLSELRRVIGGFR